MKFTKKRLAIIGAATVAVALVVGVTAGAIATSMAVPASGPSDGPIFLWDGNAGEPRESAGYVYAYDESLYWSSDAANILAPLICPAGSTGSWTFVSQPGAERSGKSGWTAYSLSGFNPNPDLEGRIEVLTPAATLNYQSDGPADGYGAIKRNGGDWSLGVACTSDNDQKVTAAFYRTIHVTAGTGAFTVDPASANK